MTGAPVKVFNHASLSVDKLWNLLDKFDQMNYVMCTIVGNDSDHQNGRGIESLHAYSVISCHSDHEVRLLKIRNPWGYGEWTG